MVRKPTNGKVQTVPVITTTGGNARTPQVIIHADTCKLCGMPLLTATGWRIAASGESRDYTVERGAAISTVGCAFCAPDGVTGVLVEPGALKVWCEAFGLYDRVLAIRTKLAAWSPSARWQPRLAAVDVVDRQYSRGKYAPGKDESTPAPDASEQTIDALLASVK
jgi:hypothetical protein